MTYRQVNKIKMALLDDWKLFENNRMFNTKSLAFHLHHLKMSDDGTIYKPRLESICHEMGKKNNTNSRAENNSSSG